MKQFTEDMKMVIQGDVAFTRVDEIPTGGGFKPAEADKNGKLVVAHSETGHNHAFDDDGDVTVLEHPSNDFVGYLKIDKPTQLKHYRSFDPHETIEFAPGTYRINRQREYTPKGFRRVID